jgi:hypothetical protein
MVIDTIDYKKYKVVSIIEAERILSKKEEFILCCESEIPKRMIKLQDLSDFFYIEGEYEISNELESIGNALQIRQFLKF